jgi:uncharacterized protein YndB with AHSA1/START domain
VRGEASGWNDRARPDAPLRGNPNQSLGERVERKVGAVSVTVLRFEQAFDLAPAIVWDALTDPELLVGWLALTRIEARVAGAVEFRWLTDATSAPTRGTVVAFDPDARLTIDTDNRGRLDFVLQAIAGEQRATGTALGLTVTIEVEPAFSGRARTEWQQSIDRLGELLRGHPTDWAALVAATRSSAQLDSLSSER